MKLTKVEEEGLRLAMSLAIHGKQITLPELAEKEDLSEALVAKILGKLRQGGIVKALRGRNGGYELSAEPSHLTVAAIMKALGKPILEGCYNKKVPDGELCCPHGTDCGLRPVWMRIEDLIRQTMEQITLQDLVTSEKHVKRRVDTLLTPPSGGGAVMPENEFGVSPNVEKVQSH